MWYIDTMGKYHTAIKEVIYTDLYVCINMDRFQKQFKYKKGSCIMT